MNDLNGQEIHAETAVTLLWTGFATAIALAVILVLEAFLDGAPLVDGKTVPAKLALLLAVVSLAVSFLIGLRRWRRRWHLYAFAGPCVVAVFCLVYGSGGLTKSPFVTLYPILLSVAIIITKRPQPVIFVGGLIVVTLALNAYLQARLQGDVDAFGPTITDLYLFKYFIVNAFALGIVGIADWKSHDFSSAQKTN